jgi:hypothetical protein
MQNASAIGATRINVNNGNEMHYETIRNRLTYLAGNAPDSNAIAEATLSTWGHVADRLAPVIGRRGIDALFNRSLHVTCKTFPWLAIGGEEVNGAAQLAGLRMRLAGRDPEAAAEASYVLLVTFTVLLATLIGESLTERLLEPVWMPPSANTEEI